MKLKIFSLLSFLLLTSLSAHHPHTNIQNNFLLSPAPTHPLNTNSQQLYYWSLNGFSNGNFAVAWPDNSAIPVSASPQQFDLVIGSGNVKSSSSCSKNVRVRLNDPVTAIDVVPAVFVGNSSTIVNPAKEGNIVAITTVTNLNLPSSDPNRRLLWRAVSFDGGETFPLVGPIYSIPNVVVDTLSSVDDFGNIWVTYLSGPASGARNLTILVSSDWGVSFTEVIEIVPPAFYVNGFDIPTSTFGGDGEGGKGMWFAPTLIDSTNVTPTLIFIPVSGRGVYDVGSLKSVIYASMAAFDWEPSIAVSKKGEVFVVSVESSASTQSGNDGIKFFRKLDGINNLVDGNFEGPTIIQQRYIAPYASAPFISTGTFLTVSPSAIVYNNDCRALSVIFTDLLGPNSPDFGVYLINSNDKGTTWSERYSVSNNTDGARGLHASVAIDKHSKGNLFASWWDTRNDPTQTTVEMFGAVITPEQLKVCKSRHQCSIND